MRPATRTATRTTPSAPPAPPQPLSPAALVVYESVWSASPGYKPTDARVIARYADLTARRSEMLAILAVEGWTCPGGSGQPVAHPLAKIVDATEGKLSTLEDRLGLSPESRIRLGLGPVAPVSKLTAFMAADNLEMRA
ncbi:MAG: phage terminase small subunit P27 family [Acidimicrobiia bacterium]